jgi:hypothetical protein
MQMRKFRTGVAIAALLITVAAVIGLDRYGKAVDDGPWKEYQHTPSKATYEITMPDGIYTLIAPHELSYKELEGWLKGSCTVDKCPVASSSW